LNANKKDSYSFFHVSCVPLSEQYIDKRLINNSASG
jgi:hypothetical protein